MCPWEGAWLALNKYILSNQAVNANVTFNIDLVMLLMQKLAWTFVNVQMLTSNQNGSRSKYQVMKVSPGGS